MQKFIAIISQVTLATVACVASQHAHAQTALSLDPPVLDLNALQRFGVDPSQVATDSDYRLSYKANGRVRDGAIFEAKRLGESSVFATNFSAVPDGTNRSVTRLESSWSHSIDDGKRQLSLGDGISNSGGWGDSIRFGGVRFGSSEAPRSDLITSPRLRTYGEAVIPTVADLIIDKSRPQLTGDTRSFIADGLPRVNGPDQANLLVRDAFGSTQVITQPLTGSSKFVAKGHSDYAIDIGKVREDFGISSLQYGRWFASSMLRYGLNNDVTLNWRAAQLNGESGVIGLGVNGRVSPSSIVSATVASSNSVQQDGWLARLGYEYSDQAVKLVVRHRVQSPGYKDIGASAATTPIKQRTLASVGVNMGALGNFAVTGAAQTYADNEHGDIIALSHQVPIKSLGVISTAAAYSTSASSATSLLVSFTHKFANRYTRRVLDLRQMANIFENESFIDALGHPAMPQFLRHTP